MKKCLLVILVGMFCLGAANVSAKEGRKPRETRREKMINLEVENQLLKERIASLEQENKELKDAVNYLRHYNYDLQLDLEWAKRNIVRMAYELDHR